MQTTPSLSSASIVSQTQMMKSTESIEFWNSLCQLYEIPTSELHQWNKKHLSPIFKSNNADIRSTISREFHEELNRMRSMMLSLNRKSSCNNCSIRSSKGQEDHDEMCMYGEEAPRVILLKFALLYLEQKPKHGGGGGGDNNNENKNVHSFHYWLIQQFSNLLYSLMDCNDVNDYGTLSPTTTDATKNLYVNLTILLFNNRARSYSSIGKWQLAILDYDSALSMSPTFAIALHNRGLCYQHLQWHDRSVDDFSASLLIEPSNFDTWVCRARSYEALGFQQLVVDDYTRALYLKATEGVLSDRGNMLFSMGKFDRAYKDYKRALQFNSRNHKVWFNMALCQIMKEQPNENQALLYVNRAIQLEERESDALEQLHNKKQKNNHSKYYTLQNQLTKMIRHGQQSEKSSLANSGTTSNLKSAIPAHLKRNQEVSSPSSP